MSNPFQHTCGKQDTPPETPLAKSAIPRLPITRAIQAVSAETLYRQLHELAESCGRTSGTAARELLIEAANIVDQATRELLTVRHG